MPDLGNLYYWGGWIIRAIMLVVITRDKRPTSAMAWLMVVLAEPWIGLIIYALIGRNHLPQRRIEKHARLVRSIRALASKLKDNPNLERPQLGPNIDQAVTLAQKLGYMPILGNNSIELMTDTNEVIDRLIADIDETKEHVHLLFYIFMNDETGRRVGEALLRAVERRVTCRLLVDAVGSKQFLKGYASKLKEAGVEVHPMLPVGIFRSLFSRIDLRNHRKLAVLDGRIAYTGSQNIVDANYGTKDLVWYDTMARIKGPVLIALQILFIMDWYFDTGQVLKTNLVIPEPQKEGNACIQPLPSGPNYPTENYLRMIVAAIHAARERVIITTPYFIPDETFLHAMQTAVLRGVEVILIVPEESDQVLVHKASRAYFEDVLKAGVMIFQHTNGLLHAKTMSIDNKISFYGTSNFDIRSFSLNFELNLVFYGEEETGNLVELQESYMRDSNKISYEEWMQRPAYKQLLQNILKLFSPLL